MSTPSYYFNLDSFVKTRVQCKKDEPKTNTFHYWVVFPLPVWGSANVLVFCSCVMGCHYSLQPWSQRCDSKKQVLIDLNKNEGFWLLMNSRQRVLQWLTRQSGTELSVMSFILLEMLSAWEFWAGNWRLRSLGWDLYIWLLLQRAVFSG